MKGKYVALDEVEHFLEETVGPDEELMEFEFLERLVDDPGVVELPLDPPAEEHDAEQELVLDEGGPGEDEVDGPGDVEVDGEEVDALGVCAGVGGVLLGVLVPETLECEELVGDGVLVHVAEDVIFVVVLDGGAAECEVEEGLHLLLGDELGVLGEFLLGHLDELDEEVARVEEEEPRRVRDEKKG